MFPKRMEFWNRIVFQKMLEKYAVSEEENQLMVQIDSVIADVDGDGDDTYGDDDDSLYERRENGALKFAKKSVMNENLSNFFPKNPEGKVTS